MDGYTPLSELTESWTKDTRKRLALIRAKRDLGHPINRVMYRKRRKPIHGVTK